MIIMSFFLNRVSFVLWPKLRQTETFEHVVNQINVGLISCLLSTSLLYHDYWNINCCYNF
uniref:Uncharacterized protein n=1 Tax=Arundo donax TaxID=35708 RepID=A0A0A9A7Z2_ARUDO